ncbi:AP-1 complex subunit mu-1 [Parelaphostrongylus tenuis]|uniref:AP-1 complex subunit mu-1 n=1 Tax=Parelaphostrongylus tenuis TaxID=148309 RepID=A0AAD5LYX9_PARTN|nr:AP-1 complex subunit mu-1 [Parelaphostrongylus tenuis]
MFFVCLKVDILELIPQTLLIAEILSASVTNSGNDLHAARWRFNSTQWFPFECAMRKSQFKRQSIANHVEVIIPVPSDADSPKFKTSVGSVKYVPELNAFVWTIRSFPGGREYLMRAHFSLPSIVSEEVEGKPPMQVKFEIPYYTTSGLQVRYLKIIEKSGYQAMPWEFHREFLYKWIERLSKLDEHFDDDGSTRVLGYMVVFVVSVFLFVLSASLMLVFYRRVDPRYPTLNPQRLTLRELFGTLKPLHEKVDEKSCVNAADRTGIPTKSTTNVTQTSPPATEVLPGNDEDAKEHIVAVTTNVTQRTPVASSITRKIEKVTRSIAESSSTAEIVIKPTRTENRKDTASTKKVTAQVLGRRSWPVESCILSWFRTASAMNVEL